MDYENCPGSLGCDFVGNWFAATSGVRKIHSLLYIHIYDFNAPEIEDRGAYCFCACLSFCHSVILSFCHSVLLSETFI